MKGVFNREGRRSGGNKKTKILIGDGVVGNQSLPCKENRHKDCDGYLTFFPKLKGYKCICLCHKRKDSNL